MGEVISLNAHTHTEYMCKVNAAAAADHVAHLCFRLELVVFIWSGSACLKRSGGTFSKAGLPVCLSELLQFNVKHPRTL